MATKRKFCCMILSGYGTGEQAGSILQQHLQTNGMDAYLVTPCGAGRKRLSRRFWVHAVRMEYLKLKKQYEHIALIGLSIGGVLQMHLVEFHPAAAVFINTPTSDTSFTELRRLFRRDLQPGLGTMLTPFGYYQFYRFMQETKQHAMTVMECPTLILQSRDDKVSDPDHAEDLYKRLRTGEKYIRYYERGGHNVLDSRMNMAVCSDVFQFCSSIRGDVGVENQPLEL